MTRGATKTFLAASVLAGAQAAVLVTEPSEGLQVVAGRIFTVEWSGRSDKSRIELDLYHCGKDCDDVDWCCEWFTALCDYDKKGGCKHGAGECGVKMPEPPLDEGTYKVCVKESGHEGCSAPFSLIASHDAPTRDEPGGQSLEVLSPKEHDGAVVGEGYTVEFAYDNGLGSSTERFGIDLYQADRGNGDCGEYVAALCDKPDVGCKDSRGDYDVEIPRDVRPGEYSIRVGLFDDESMYACSGRFSIVRDERLYEGEEGGDGDFFRDPKDDYYYNSDDAMSMSYGFDLSDDDSEGDDWWKASDLDDDVASADDSWSWDDDREQGGRRGRGRGRHHSYSYSYSFSYSYSYDYDYKF